jgi:hypothetical protein
LFVIINIPIETVGLVVLIVVDVVGIVVVDVVVVVGVVGGACTSQIFEVIPSTVGASD